MASGNSNFRDGVPNLDIDPFDEDFLTDPYPYHEQMREAGPAVWLSKYGIWGVARHEEGAEILKDYKRFCSSAGVGLANFKSEKPFRPPSLLIEADPPEHTRARNVVGRALSQKNVAALQEAFEAEAELLVDQILEKGEIDGMKDLAIAFPLKVFPDAVGLEEEGRDKLLRYGNMVFNVFGPPNRLFTEAVAEAAELTEWITAHCMRDALAPGSIGQIIYEGADTGEVTEAEAGLLVRSLLSAGVDTTISSIGNMLYCFTENPGEWDKLRSAPSLTKHVIEEVIRLEGPVQTFFRTSVEATEISGVQIGANEKLVLFLGACNRDPRRWDDPDKFDIARKPVGHLAFGSGVHRCVGQRIAQLEAEVILRKMAERIKRIEPIGPSTLRLNNTIRVRESIPMRVIAA
ncbi:MAG: cytochrome P450 [Rhodospirillales bacterium]|nr:cytochrome P450 [Rhodospirillales bacterium]